MQHRNRGTRDERGNIIVVMAVIMVLAVPERRGRRRARSRACTAPARARTSAPRSPTPTPASPTRCSASTSSATRPPRRSASATTRRARSRPCPARPASQYTARRVDDNTYTVLSKGLVNGQPHAIQATVEPLVPLSVRDLRQDVDHVQRQQRQLRPRRRRPGRSRPSTRAATPCSHPRADVASNGQITCHGSDSPAHHQDYFNGGGTSCDNGYLLPGSYNPQDPTLDLPGAGEHPDHAVPARRRTTRARR